MTGRPATLSTHGDVDRAQVTSMVLLPQEAGSNLHSSIHRAMFDSEGSAV